MQLPKEDKHRSMYQSSRYPFTVSQLGFGLVSDIQGYDFYAANPQASVF